MNILADLDAVSCMCTHILVAAQQRGDILLSICIILTSIAAKHHTAAALIQQFLFEPNFTPSFGAFKTIV
jgi:hypothetical protein